jgi:hypothetical protein
MNLDPLRLTCTACTGKAHHSSKRPKGHLIEHLFVCIECGFLRVLTMRVGEVAELPPRHAG